MKNVEKNKKSTNEPSNEWITKVLIKSCITKNASEEQKCKSYEYIKFTT